MKFTLKDYEELAVDEVLRNLKRARANFKNPSKRENSSFSLTATTGAGKTVMAAAAIEALFWGTEAFDFAPDPGAVVLWFSDSPDLNKQTFNRLLQASEKFTYTNLIDIKPPFARPRLDAGKVYFLNTQKLSATSKLVRRADGPVAQGRLTNTSCKECKYEKERKFKLRPDHADRVRQYSLTPKMLWVRYRSGAQQKGHIYDLPLDYFIEHFWSKPCHYCGDLVPTAGWIGWITQ